LEVCKLNSEYLPLTKKMVIPALMPVTWGKYIARLDFLVSQRQSMQAAPGCVFKRSRAAFCHLQRLEVLSVPDTPYLQEGNRRPF
jgi:hypothetical protein